MHMDEGIGAYVFTFNVFLKNSNASIKQLLIGNNPHAHNKWSTVLQEFQFWNASWHITYANVKPHGYIFQC